MAVVRVRPWQDARGTTSLELALVLPAFLVFIAGAFLLGGLLWSYSSLNYAAEEAARCASVKTTVCKDAGSTASYAASHYYGPGSPAFSYSAAGCGSAVNATLTYSFNIRLLAVSVPLSASACFP